MARKIKTREIVQTNGTVRSNKKMCGDLRAEAARWMSVIYDHLDDVGLVPSYGVVKKTAYVVYTLESLARQIGAIKDEDGPWDIQLDTPLSDEED